MNFLSIVKKIKEEVSKITLSGVKEAANAVDKWDDAALSALSAAFPGNPGILALKEIEPRILRGILGAIEAAEESDWKNKRKMIYASGILVKDPDVPEITKLDQAEKKIQTVFDIIKGVKKII